MKGILAAGAAVAILGGSLYLGLDGASDTGPTDPVAIVELRPVVLPGECVPPPGDEPLDDCAEWICRVPKAAREAYAKTIESWSLGETFGEKPAEPEPTECLAIAMRRPAGCVSQANSYEVDGKTLPGCLPEAAPGSDACTFPAETWLTWKAASDAHKARLEVCREQVELGNGSCLCKSRQKVGTVDGELSDASALPAGKRTRLVACPPKVKGQGLVYWERDVGEPKAGCVVAARPLVTVTAGDLETDLVTQLRAACEPCVVTGNAWGRCPSCLAEPGGCAEACR